jgi:4-hydroxythreonine-4-phosphate dehydrogenase
MTNRDKIKVGISHGDINGISYEVILKTLLDPRILEICIPIIYGSPKVAAYHRKALNIDNLSFNHIRHPAEATAKRASIINCIDDNIRVELGKSTSMAGESSYMALERAVNDLHNGDIDALVTAPINKNNIQSERFAFPGHTEYLTQKFGATDFLMLMVNDQLRIGVATGHIPLANVSEHLTKELILSKLTILHRSLVEDFRITSPRIAVLGLNPHAGDNGLLGKEEMEIILPAIQEIRDQGMIVMGPYSADGFFGSGDYTRFDATLAMYHDQGLAPFKLISFERGVNFTAGLPVVRTSPDHGTAFNIAGEGKASPDSFREALYLAIDICKNREIYAEISKDPLKKFDINPNHVDESIDMETNEEDSDV